MKTIEVKIIYKDQPPTYDWIPEHELAATLTEISCAGLGAEVVGEVSWQRQLATMENPEL